MVPNCFIAQINLVLFFFMFAVGLHVFPNHVHPYCTGENGTSTFVARDLFNRLHNGLGVREGA